MSNWEEMILGDYIDLIPGYAFSSDLFNDSIGMPLIRIRDFESQNPITYYSGEYDGKYIVNPGDKLISMDGEFNIIEWKGSCSLLNQRVCKIQSNNNEKMDIQFLMYRLVRELKNIEARTPATTVKHLSLKDLQFLKLSIPPLKEQQKIAEILSSVDAAIEKTEQVITKTEEVKKGLIQQLLTKGIDHKEFKDSKIGEIPITWEVKKFKEITDVLKCGVASTPTYVEKGVPFLSAQNVKKGKLRLEKYNFVSEEYHEKLTKNVLPCRNDILLTRVGANIGEAALVDIDFEFSVYVSLTHIRMNQGLNPMFYVYLLNSDKYQKLSKHNQYVGGGVQNLNVKVVEEFLMPIPPLEEQNKIVNILSSHDEKIVIESRKLENLNKVKKRLMQQLLTGQVRVKVY